MKPLELLLSQNLDLAHAPELSSNMNGASGTDFRNTRPPVGRSHGPTFGWNTHGTPDGSNQARPPGNNEDADAAYRQGIIWRPRQALGPPLHPSRRSDASILLSTSGAPRIGSPVPVRPLVLELVGSHHVPLAQGKTTYAGTLPRHPPDVPDQQPCPASEQEGKRQREK